MMIVIGSGDCGNSPKNQFLEDLSVAIALGDTGKIFRGVTEDAAWEIVGKTRVQGRQNLAEAVEQVQFKNLVEVRILHVASHGRTGAANGVQRGADGKTLHFCHMFEFGSLKGTNVKEIMTYQIETS